MNAATQASILKALEAIASGTFDEFHVKSLVMDLRDAAPKDSLVAELGHFVAHPKQRDRGLNHANVVRMIDELRAYLERRGPLHIHPTFDGDELVGELRTVVAATGCSDEVGAINRYRRDILLCMLVLMQGAGFRYLKNNATAYLTRFGSDDRLALVCTFELKDLGVEKYDRPFIEIALPLVVTDIPAPPALMAGKDEKKMRMSLYRTARNPEGHLTLLDMDETA